LIHTRGPASPWRALDAALDRCTRLNQTQPGATAARGAPAVTREHPLFVAMKVNPKGLIQLTDELLDSTRFQFPDK